MSKIIVASDAPSVRSEVLAVVDSPNNEIREISSGPQLMRSVADDAPDLVVVDLQMGNMGGMAVCLDLRLEASYGALPHIPVLMLLDRRADVFLRPGSGAEGWIVKPMDPIRLRKATSALLSGSNFHDDSFLPLPALVRNGATAPGDPVAPQPKIG